MTFACRGVTHIAAVLVVVCVLASGILAQSTAAGTQDAKPKNSAGAAEATPSNSAVASATRAHDDSFIIGVDDVLAVNVWKEPEISRSVPVRSDGKISVPLVGEVTAAGETPKKLEAEITSKLQNYISEPEVTVIVQQIKSQKINILGQVARPGSYPLSNPTTVLDAIALAGGFRDFAKKKSIYVLRQAPDGTPTRLPFNYKDVISGKHAEQNIKLEPRDTVYVP